MALLQGYLYSGYFPQEQVFSKILITLDFSLDSIPSSQMTGIMKYPKELLTSFAVSSYPNMNLSPIVNIKTSLRIGVAIQNNISTPS